MNWILVAPEFDPESIDALVIPSKAALAAAVAGSSGLGVVLRELSSDDTMTSMSKSMSSEPLEPSLLKEALILPTVMPSKLLELLDEAEPPKLSEGLSIKDDVISLAFSKSPDPSEEFMNELEDEDSIENEALIEPSAADAVAIEIVRTSGVRNFIGLELSSGQFVVR
ncbi:unnamed protein product [Peronospora belbahrii]|uniref:Uncharacterized protein n=1 Tax=Peronospora belbahrii TaxID=622444 RepID=A0AAU9KSJ2_9STRA|nr:unnamed protein product [Peronospora belbahrii]